MEKRAQNLPDRGLVARTVQTQFPFYAELADIVPLAGDASNRRYFRLKLIQGPVQSLILMQLADPEGFKVSEEAVSKHAQQITELPFANILSHLAACEIPVPTLYHYDETHGLLYLEDFGDLTFEQAVHAASPSERCRLYHEAIDLLVDMQVKATKAGSDKIIGTAKALHESQKAPACLAFTRAFEVPLLMWEFEHFAEYGIVTRRGQLLCHDDWVTIQQEFQKMAELVAGQPRVFTHRDYHSRNLMATEGRRLGVLDFQDALMGPVTYDLASLLRDSYYELDDALLDALLERYMERLSSHVDQTTRERMLLTDRTAFRRLFDWTSIQRNLKAAGRFVYIDRVKNNSKFLEDIPRTLGYVRRNLAKYPELDTLRKHLSLYVPELA